MCFWPSGSQYSISQNMVHSTNGGIIELRTQFSSGAFTICRVSASGTPLWRKEVVLNDTFGMFYTKNILELPGGDFLVSGAVSNQNYPTQNGHFAMRFDSTGNLLWKKLIRINAQSRDEFTLYSPFGQGTLYFVSSCYNNAISLGGVHILKTDVNGNILDSAFFQIDQSQFAVPKAGIINSQGDLVLAGGSYQKLYFMRLDTSLQMMDTRSLTCLNGPQTVLTVNNIIEMPGNNYIIASKGSTTPNWIFKLDSAGHILNQVGINKANTTFFNISFLAVNSSGYFFAAGHSGYSPTNQFSCDLLCFTDTLSPVSFTSYFGTGPAGLLMYNDHPLISSQPYFGATGEKPVAYFETDSIGNICTSIASPVSTATVPLFTETISAVNYYAAPSSSVLTFVHTETVLTSFVANDFCLFNGEQEINDNTAITLSPSPATEYLQLHVSSYFSDYTVIIFDLMGRPVTEAQINASEINITSLANGTYVLALYAEDRVVR